MLRLNQESRLVLRRNHAAGAAAFARIGPAMNLGNIEITNSCDDLMAAELLDNAGGWVAHNGSMLRNRATLRKSQCDVNANYASDSHCVFRNSSHMKKPAKPANQNAWILEALTAKAPRKTQRGLAKALNMDATGVNRLVHGQRRLQASEITPVQEYLELEDDDLPPGLVREKASRHLGEEVVADENDLDVVLTPGNHAASISILELEIRPGSGGPAFGEVVTREAGNGLLVSEDKARGEWKVPAHFFRELGLSNKGLYLFKNVGDSMTKPDGTGLLSGDLIMADTKDRLPSPPGIFALWDGVGTIVKRLEYIPNSDPHRIKIKSDNPAHDNYERTAEEVNIIGRCVWFGRPL